MKQPSFKTNLFSGILMSVAAVCWAMLCYGKFYRGETGFGILYAVLICLLLTSAVLNFMQYRKQRDKEDAKEDDRPEDRDE